MKVYNVLVINEVNEIKTFDTKEKAQEFKESRVEEIINNGYEIDTETDNYVYAIGEEDEYTIEIFESEVE